MTSPPVDGFVQDRFAAVREVFEGHLASGADVGASFTVTIEGETVVDLWGGWADAARTRAWGRDTIVNVYSTTKTMMALTALVLADRGELDFAAPIARYWPEFAANGKAGVTVGHAMSHAAGLSGWADTVTPQDLYDWEKVTGLLARQAPFWAPGTASGYHAFTQGFLLGEVVRRITGRTLGTVFREEIAEPLGADFHIGLAPEHDLRVADLIEPPPGASIADGEPTELARNMSTNPGVVVSETRGRAWRGAEIPAANGHGNARAIARIMAVLANGGAVNGRRLLSEAGCRRALEAQIDGVDLIFGVPVRFGLGFGLPGRLELMPLPNPNSIYWAGYGGSMAVADFDARASFGFAMNRMVGGTTGDARTHALMSAVWAALGR